MPAHYTPLHLAVADAVASRAGVAATDVKVEVPARAELGDLAVGCFAFAKAQKKNPAELAKEIAAAIQPNEYIASATAAGPYINFKVDRAHALRWTIGAARDSKLVPQVGHGEAICIDYSSPNISKHLAYHHIRSTVLGHALAKIFNALGFKSVGINFVGDWGTTHGMIIAAYKRWGADEPLTIEKLNVLYRRYRDEEKTDAALAAEGPAWFKRLEDGDAEARALWKRFYDVSWAEFQSAYDQLGVVFDEVRGESAYEADLPGVMTELRGKGMVTESEGAQVVALPGVEKPVLLQKADGATLYATRDFASAKYRWNTYHFARSLYVVAREQALHFKEVFSVLKLAGYDWADKCEHVAFGLVRMGGKKTGTRTGNVVLLKDVFRQAEDGVRARIAESVPADQVDATTRTVGVGAVVFGNLSAQRDKDIDFDWDKVLSTDGDSGPYLMYSHARCASILRKANEPIGAVDFGKLATDAEWAVAKRLLDFGDTVARAGAACEPHVICHYLLELAGDFSRWYTAGNGDASLRVLCEDAPTRQARLALVDAVKTALRDGLALLGLGAPEQM